MNEQLEYIETVVQIYFDPEHFACEFCPLLETYSRKQCRKTAEYLSHDTRYGVGRYCPLIKIDNNYTEDNNND